MDCLKLKKQQEKTENLLEKDSNILVDDFNNVEHIPQQTVFLYI